MADVLEIFSGSGIKRTGGVYATGRPLATIDDRTYDEMTPLEGGAQNASGNATPMPPWSVVTTGCLEGYGSQTSPLTITLDPVGGITCGPNGLCASGGGGLVSINVSGCIDGVGTAIDPIYVSLAPSGGLVCGVNGLSVSGASIYDYFVGEFDNGNSGASKTISFATQANQKLTLTANAALTFTAPASARSTKIRFVQGGSGGYQPTASGVSGTIPSLASGISASTVVNFFYDSDGNWHV